MCISRDKTSDRILAIEICIITSTLNKLAVKIGSKEPDSLGDKMIRCSLKLSLRSCADDPQPLINEAKELIREAELIRLTQPQGCD